MFVQSSFIPAIDSILLLVLQVSLISVAEISCLEVYNIDHSIHYMDMRMPQAPLHQLKGHRKAVSYVQFMSNSEVVSA